MTNPNSGLSHPQILNLFVSAKTAFPNKVTFIETENTCFVEGYEVSQLSVTMTNTGDSELKNRKGLLCLIVSEVSVYGRRPHCFGPGVAQSIRADMRGRGGSKERDRKGSESQCSHKGAPLMTYLPPSRHHFLKVPLLPNSTTGWEPCLQHMHPWGTFHMPMVAATVQIVNLVKRVWKREILSTGPLPFVCHVPMLYGHGVFQCLLSRVLLSSFNYYGVIVKEGDRRGGA